MLSSAPNPFSAWFCLMSRNSLFSCHFTSNFIFSKNGSPEKRFRAQCLQKYFKYFFVKWNKNNFRGSSQNVFFYFFLRKYWRISAQMLAQTGNPSYELFFITTQTKMGALLSQIHAKKLFRARGYSKLTEKLITNW